MKVQDNVKSTKKMLKNLEASRKEQTPVLPELQYKEFSIAPAK